jgi:hypothetical protein
MEFWTFLPAIEPPNLKANLPENHANILISGQNDPSINGYALRRGNPVSTNIP